MSPSKPVTRTHLPSVPHPDASQTHGQSHVWTVKTRYTSRTLGTPLASDHFSPLPSLDFYLQVMQNPSSYYVVPKSDGRIWPDWGQSGRRENCSWSSSSSSSTLGEGSFSRRSPMKDLTQCRAIPMSYTLTPPTPSTTDSDASSSQVSMDSIPEYDDMPEIPFVSAAITYSDRWMSSDRPAERLRVDDNSSSTSFWSGIIGLRPSTSKSSAYSGSPVLGHTNERIFAPSRTRKRSGSVSSIASSRTRPAPAKSILSSSSSVRTRRRKAPSVKFLDIPTVHYEEDDYNDGYDHDNYHTHDGDAREQSSCMSPPPSKKARGLSGFFSFKWLFAPSSSSPISTPSPSKKTKTRVKVGSTQPQNDERPTISGPFPLCDTRPRRARGAASSTTSLHSMRSTGSLRSVRSCGSRLPTPTYWPR